MTEREPVGVVGLGRLGLPVARRLLAAGHRVGGVDISEPARERAAEAEKLAWQADLGETTSMTEFISGS